MIACPQFVNVVFWFAVSGPSSCATGLELELRVELDKANAVVGDTVKLREMIPMSSNLRVSGIYHHVLLIGQYDRGANKMVNLSPQHYREPLLDLNYDCLEGLHRITATYHGLYYEVIQPGMKGTEIKIRPTKPGIYLITSCWGVWGKEKVTVSGSPVVLTVRPKTNAK
ncbi:hypothetical protein [Fimbriiglobus ruber]|uniref:hypothetical protein n=1 Tax=Fimbriiglobus ruber TaxID=1908690 RepID=UPI001179D6D1|nr:hypothetical protein [Fimbriiglobus ruber]